MLALNNSFAESKHYYINKINTLTSSIPMTKNAWQIVPLSIEKLQPELTFQINDFAVIFHHKKSYFPLFPFKSAFAVKMWLGLIVDPSFLIGSWQFEQGNEPKIGGWDISVLQK